MMNVAGSCWNNNDNVNHSITDYESDNDNYSVNYYDSTNYYYSRNDHDSDT